MTEGREPPSPRRVTPPRDAAADLGDPNQGAPGAKQWLAFGIALVVLTFVAIWIAGARQGERRRVPSLAGQRLAGVWQATEVRAGCGLEDPAAAGALFAVHPGRLPMGGPSLQRCEAPADCEARTRARALGVTPPPVPLPLLGGGCAGCAETAASLGEVSWEEALTFPMGLEGALDPASRALTGERETAREAEGRCLRFRYLAELSREGAALIYERRVFFGAEHGACADRSRAPDACADARRWRLEPRGGDE